MPTFILVGCAKCKTFQVTQLRKPQGNLQVSKFVCKVCGEQQSVQREMGRSTRASDLRATCQELNMRRGQHEQQQQEQQEEQPQHEVQRVLVQYDAAFDVFRGSDDEENNNEQEEEEEVLLYRPDALKARRKEKRPRKPKAEEEEDVPQSRQMVERREAPKKAEKREEAEDELELDDVVLTRHKADKFVRVEDEEVWRDEDEDQE
jgi:hypothetical protein